MKFVQTPTPLPLGEKGFRHVAFDGKHYYFTIFAKKCILKTTKEFFPLEYIPTSRVYDCLCFDPNLCCYWGSISGCCGRIFQLNCHLEEISTLCLPRDVEDYSPKIKEIQGTISGISHNTCENSLLIAYPWGVKEYLKNENKWGDFPEITLKKHEIITEVAVICPGILVVSRKEKQQLLQIFFKDGTKIKEITLPNYFSVRSLLYQPCTCETAHLDFFGTTGGCYPQVAREPITAHELGFEPCFCNEQICEKICCPPVHSNPVDDVLESIALVESALSHILNAQGEELQKVVAESVSIEEMLYANEKVNETITKVTHLEMLLHNKLEALTKLCPCEDVCSPQSCKESLEDMEKRIKH